MKIRKETKQNWMICLIVVMTIVGTGSLAVAAISRIETGGDLIQQNQFLQNETEQQRPETRNSLLSFSNASAEIDANEQNGPITVSSSTPVSITIGLSAGIDIGTYADWWLVVSTPFGLYSWVYPTGWTSGLFNALQLPLFGFSGLEIFNSALPVGVYVFYFGVDTNADNVLNELISYDAVEVHVID